MKKFLLVIALSVSFAVSAQTLRLIKGKSMDSLVVNDSISETFALYLPTNFETSKEWPIVFVFDMNGRAKQAIGIMREAAEKEGYILAGSNNVNDSLSITQNVLVSTRMINQVASLLPIDRERIYTAGFAAGGRLASVLPTFIRKIAGVLSFGAAITNIDGFLNIKKPFHFVGVVGNEDYNYPQMLENEKQLKKIKFPNQLYVFDGGAKWPSSNDIVTALQTFTLAAMAKGKVIKDEKYIKRAYSTNLTQVNTFLGAQQPLLAQTRIWEMIEVFQPHMALDSLRSSAKLLRKTKLYRSQKRSQNTALFTELLSKEDYTYYLEDDILTYNYNNLGWWKYQMEVLQEYETGEDVFEKHMAKRLQGYIDALIEDNLDILVQQKQVDFEAVNFLWMLKTITQPDKAENYLQVISNSALQNDYGTAIFYLEELLKTGYTDIDKIYTIDHTALLRITPRFNKVIETYLKDARYDVIKE